MLEATKLLERERERVDEAFRVTCSPWHKPRGELPLIPQRRSARDERGKRRRGERGGRRER